MTWSWHGNTFRITGSPHKVVVMQSSDVFFVLHLGSDWPLRRRIQCKHMCRNHCSFDMQNLMECKIQAQVIQSSPCFVYRIILIFPRFQWNPKLVVSLVSFIEETLTRKVVICKNLSPMVIVILAKCLSIFAVTLKPHGPWTSNTLKWDVIAYP